MAVAAPAYIDAHGAPAHPRELVRHRCIGWRPAPGVMPYRWEFSEHGRDFTVDKLALARAHAALQGSPVPRMGQRQHQQRWPGRPRTGPRCSFIPRRRPL